jgi:ankyrin repeat protein
MCAVFRFAVCLCVCLSWIGRLGKSDLLQRGGWTALIRAAMHGHADCVRLLLDAGADKEAKNDVRGRVIFRIIFSL